MKGIKKTYLKYGGLFFLAYVVSILAMARMMRPIEQPPQGPPPMISPAPLATPSTLPTPSPGPPVEVITSEKTYIVKQEEDFVAVYVEGDPTPQKILDIDVNQLRQYDRERLKEGIVVHSLEELAQLEEDFSS